MTRTRERGPFLLPPSCCKTIPLSCTFFCSQIEQHKRKKERSVFFSGKKYRGKNGWGWKEKKEMGRRRRRSKGALSAATYRHCVLSTTTIRFPHSEAKKQTFLCASVRDYRLGVKKKFFSLLGIHVSGILLLYLFHMRTIWTFFC